MFKRFGLKIASTLLSVLILCSCFAAATSAVTDQDLAQISVTASNTNPTKDEIITVTVSIDNYRTMSPRIAAMFLSVSFDTACFDYFPESEKVLLKTNNDDLTSIAFDGIDKVSFAYTYANTKKQTLPNTASEIFSFKLRVKSDVAAKTLTGFTVEGLKLYNGKNEAEYSEIGCKEPKTDSLTVWASRPGILLNNSDRNEGTYNENVTVTFDSATASLVYEGREAVSVTSPYLCDKNGRYTVTVKQNGVDKTESFVIDKTISHISVKAGTYMTEYPLGVSPDYSAWVLLVTYADGTYSELPMDDSDIQVTGFDPNSIGQQQLLVKYKDKTTHVSVSVNSKTVISFSIKSPIAKTEYLIGDEIDTTGGVLLVIYDDGTSEEIDITKNMLSGYDKAYLGNQTVTVTYSGVSQSFSINYISREPVDELIMAIDALDLSSISESSRELLTDLIKKYNALNALQKSAVTNIAKLEYASDLFHSIITPGSDTEALQPTTDPATVTEPKDNDNDSSRSNIIWFVVGGIIILSVIGGIIYFLVIYFKRKKEIDEDEYYDDGDFDDDADDDGTVSYDEKILDIDEDEDEEQEEEPEEAGTEEIADMSEEEPEAEEAANPEEDEPEEADEEGSEEEDGGEEFKDEDLDENLDETDDDVKKTEDNNE